MQPFLVVEGEELGESSKLSTVLIVGLEEPLDLPVRLWPSNLAEGVLDVTLVEVAFELVVKTWPSILARIGELRAVVSNHL